MKRILIVEDDRAIAELERDYLEANDYEVEICEDGESGLKRALQEEFCFDSAGCHAAEGRRLSGMPQSESIEKCTDYSGISQA